MECINANPCSLITVFVRI